MCQQVCIGHALPIFQGGFEWYKHPRFQVDICLQRLVILRNQHCGLPGFDRERGLEILGPDPTYEYVFNVNPAVHEAPVYVPSQNKLYFSQLEPGFLPQLVVDLNQNPPTLSEYLSDPPVYAPNGGTFYRGMIYWGSSGGNASIGGTEQRPGIRILDSLTNKTTTLLNNYFGYYFNTIDDLFVSFIFMCYIFLPRLQWFVKGLESYGSMDH